MSSTNSCRSSNTVYIAGTNTSLSNVDDRSPPISTSATLCSNSEPSSRPLTIANSAAITERLVMMIGRRPFGPSLLQRWHALNTGAVERVHSIHQQDRVLAHQAQQNNQAQHADSHTHTGSQ